MSAKAIMIQGTGSDVGKSVIAAALCRILSQDGYRVAPFKSQNMALNSYVTKEGFEMGRAQVAQAEAAGIEPMVEMNPILLKPMGDARSQVVVMGKPFKNMSAKEYYRDRDSFLDIIKDAYNVLKNRFDIIVIEGAGSPSEINIKKRDIVNMKMAEMANAPVILVTDIDRGGSFAWIVGTIQLLTEEERERVSGVIFNKFRGDIEILKPGYKMLEDIIDKPVLGTIPFMKDVHIEDEDSVALDKVQNNQQSNNLSNNNGDNLIVTVVKLPRISNFTDFDPLNREPGITLQYAKEAMELKDADLIILPGTKGTINDMKFLAESGMSEVIKKKAKTGTMIIGICGGYQMLGIEIRDALQVESSDSLVQGLSLINTITDFCEGKVTHQSKAEIIPGSLPFNVNGQVSGYEIHMGTTRVIDSNEKKEEVTEAWSSPFLNIIERSTKSVNVNDGFTMFNKDQFIIGTYMHGIFDNDNFRSELIKHLANKKGVEIATDSVNLSTTEKKEEGFKELETIIRSSLNMDEIYKIINA